MPLSDIPLIIFANETREEKGLSCMTAVMPCKSLTFESKLVWQTRGGHVLLICSVNTQSLKTIVEERMCLSTSLCSSCTFFGPLCVVLSAASLDPLSAAEGGPAVSGAPVMKLVVSPAQRAVSPPPAAALIGAFQGCFSHCRT